MATIHVVMKQERKLYRLVWYSVCVGLSSNYREHQLRTWGEVEEIQSFMQHTERKAHWAGLPLYMLHTVTNKKIILGPVSIPSINTHCHRHTPTDTHSLSMYMCADPCIHMCPQKVQACVRLLCFPTRTNFHPPSVWESAIDAVRGAPSGLFITVGNTAAISTNNLPHWRITHQSWPGWMDVSFI